MRTGVPSLLVAMLLVGLSHCVLAQQTSRKVAPGASITNPVRPIQSCSSITELLASEGQFDMLLTALKATGMDRTLDGTRTVGNTFFAPNNAAFTQMLKRLESTPQDLLNPENAKLLQQMLQYHLVTGQYLTTDKLEDTATFATAFRGQDIRVDRVLVRSLGSGSREQASIFILSPGAAPAKIVKPNILGACNFVVHAIDNVLVPATASSS